MPVARLLGLLAPPGCLACGVVPPDPRAVLCPDCAARLPWLRGCCPRCALPGCRRCPAADAAFAAAWAPVALRGPARALVHALKFGGLLRAADTMAAQIAASAPPWALAADGRALVPIPGDPLRRRARGLDHAALLAAALSARTGVPVRRALRRRPGAPHQVGAGRAARRAAVAGAFLPRGAAPPVAVLVDDVHTTGATLDACARALRAAGSSQVVAVCYARTLPS